MEPPPPPPRPTGPQVLLGLLILWQLFFLVSINFLDLTWEVRDGHLGDASRRAIDRAVPGWKNEDGHLSDLGDIVYKLDERWAQLTGQLQGWTLFAPNVSREFTFPAVLLRWDDDPASAPALSGLLAPLGAANPLAAAVLAAASLPRDAELLKSDNEVDVNSYFRLGLYGLRRWESDIAIALEADEDVGYPFSVIQAESIRGHLDEKEDYIKIYLQWRLRRYREAHPDRPAPAQVILLMRSYFCTDPKSAPPPWRGPAVATVARWRPQAVPEPGYSDLERFNPVWGRFDRREKGAGLP